MSRLLPEQHTIATQPRRDLPERSMASSQVTQLPIDLYYVCERVATQE